MNFLNNFVIITLYLLFSHNIVWFYNNLFHDFELSRQKNLEKFSKISVFIKILNFQLLGSMSLYISCNNLVIFDLEQNMFPGLTLKGTQFQNYLEEPEEAIFETYRHYWIPLDMDVIKNVICMSMFHLI